MQMNLYTVEVQRESPDFSDAQTVGEFRDIRIACDELQNCQYGNRRLIGWLDLGTKTSPVELIRL